MEGGDEIVLDNGSFAIKGGFSGQELPQAILPSFAATVVDETEESEDLKECGSESSGSRTALGSEALDRGTQSWKSVLVEKIVRNGQVTDWDRLEELYDHLFATQLKVDPQGRPFMFCSPFQQSYHQSDQLREIMYEVYGASAIHSQISGILSLYALGQTSGCVLDIGEDLTSCVPVFEGFVIDHAIHSQKFAGDHLTHRLSQLLRDSGFYFGRFGSAEPDIVRKIKEDVCYVTNPEKESKKLNFNRLRTIFDENYDVMKYYTLPDGKRIKVYMERFQTAEVLFDPSLIEKDHNLLGLHQLVKKTMDKCDIDLRPSLYGQIVLAGGTSMLTGMQNRLQDELDSITPKNLKVNVEAPEDRHHLGWIGGAVFASMSSFYEHAMTKQEYEEHGPRRKSRISLVN